MTRAAPIQHTIGWDTAIPWVGWLIVIGVGAWWLFRWLLPRKDIVRSELEPDLAWANEPDKALEKIYRYVTGLARSASDWYRARR